MEENNVEIIKNKKSKKKILFFIGLIILLFVFSLILFSEFIIKQDSLYEENVSKENVIAENVIDENVLEENVSEDAFKNIEYNSIEDVEKYVFGNPNYFLVYDFNYNSFEEFIENLTKNIVDENTICRHNSVFVKVGNEDGILCYFTPTTIYLNTDLMVQVEKKSNIIYAFQDIIDIMFDSGCDADMIQSFLDTVGTSSSRVASLMLLMSYKPIIYLYPEKEMELNIKMPSVIFTTTYPLYDNGWDIIAQPDGTLLDNNNREYNYLYWEGYTYHKLDMSKGFVVSKDEYIEFLEEKLEYVGLTDKEACDFISYWLPYMNEYEYCLVSFQKDYGEKVKIEYNIQPDNELVLFVAFKGLDKPIKIEEQDLSHYKNFERSGFIVVEWGGTIIE